MGVSKRTIVLLQVSNLSSRRADLHSHTFTPCSRRLSFRSGAENSQYNLCARCYQGEPVDSDCRRSTCQQARPGFYTLDMDHLRWSFHRQLVSFQFRTAVVARGLQILVFRSVSFSHLQSKVVQCPRTIGVPRLPAAAVECSWAKPAIVDLNSIWACMMGRVCSSGGWQQGS